ncbi:MAG TPA: hypothetical protein VI934_02255 [Candidatus Nanoarchaeia archaeon]|nr:hypothetical protein [Candidatus Nanoarchaeia archaeon]
MFKHMMDKWDSYLSILLGVFVAVAAKANLNQQAMLLFKYYLFIMIGVVIFDTVKNFSQHESAIWKVAAIASNGIVLASCMLILEKMFAIATAVKLSSLPQMQHILALPNFMLYLGIFLVIENALWVYVFDHF